MIWGHGTNYPVAFRHRERDFVMRTLHPTDFTQGAAGPQFAQL